ncbi:MAG: glycosyltransferase family 2 protein [Erysipelotrichaceae bacterium]|nr:glycosyltransferase family 2 protein [Clostridia bacterium]MBQ6217758.1 glycosyltransferase family 2 protein [Erysipelotrichaceae bacterium]
MAKQSNPSISIIIPVFNKAKYLDAVLKSVSEQSFQSFECILIDDGSTDGSASICRAYCEKDDRFIYYHTENKGVSHARNIGLKSITGEYVTFIDADDRVNGVYLEELYKNVRQFDADIALSNYIKVNEQGTEMKYVELPFEEKSYYIDDLLPMFGDLQTKNGILGYCWGKLVRVKLVTGHYFDENIVLAEDLDFYIRIYPYITNVSFCEQAIYYYRQQAENSSVMVRDKDIDYLTQLKICLRVKQFLISKNVYSGNNQEYIDQKIQNYIYFWLLYSNPDDFESRFSNVRNCIMKDDIPFVYCEGFKKVVLRNVHSGNQETVRMLLLLYGFLRRITKIFRAI